MESCNQKLQLKKQQQTMHFSLRFIFFLHMQNMFGCLQSLISSLLFLHDAKVVEAQRCKNHQEKNIYKNKHVVFSFTQRKSK